MERRGREKEGGRSRRGDIVPGGGERESRGLGERELDCR